MILIDKHICYSPEPPMTYTYRGAGHGSVLAGDMHAWNLAWLSTPALDFYLEQPPEHAMAQVATSDMEAFGLAAGTVRLCHHENFPDLRYLLSLEPLDFFTAFVTGPVKGLLMFQALGPEWLETMAYRVNLSMAKRLPTRPLVLTRAGSIPLQVQIPAFYEKVQR